MSIFNQKSKFKDRTEIRKIKQVVAPSAQKKRAVSAGPTGGGARSSPAAAPSNSSSSSRSTPRGSPNPSALQPPTSGSVRARTVSATSSASPEPKQPPLGSRKRPAPPPRSRQSSATTTSYASPGFSDSDSEDDDDWRDRLDPSKRWKRAATELEDPDRRLRHPLLWTGEDAEGEGGNDRTGEQAMTHAADVASLGDKCRPVMGLGCDEIAVTLRYPGANHVERYELVWGKDQIDAAADIMKAVQLVASIYLTDEEARPFVDPENGIYRRLEKSRNTNDGKGFKAALADFNERLQALQRKGVIAKNIDAMRGVPRELVDFILDQVYDRTVAPKVDLLAKYENGTDNVYGELLHPFISMIFEKTKLTSDKVFVDLGSGVGNVTLQAALERGCESWGCEVMENACNLAEAQEKEFVARCRLWGIAPGKVHLERGDFRKNERTLEALKRADVVLVNNQAFTSQLNDHLVNMFLDLKIGCKIVSLKTFVHDNKIATNDVASSILSVEHFTYPEGYVSWTGAQGTFCISTRK